MRSQPSKKLLLISRLFWVSGIVVLIVGAIISWKQYEANKIAEQTPRRAQAVSNNGPNTPPSTEKPKPSEFDSYTVAPDLPRYLFIPKLSVRAMVKPVGVSSNNQIEAPRNAFDVGWYNGSAKPGESGAMLIDGHVSGDAAAPGIFYNLKKLTAGDTFTLQRGDNKIFIYRVTTTQTYDVNKVDMAAVLAPINPSRPGLNLITCTGGVIKGTNNYDQRFVVFAEQA